MTESFSLKHQLNQFPLRAADYDDFRAAPLPLVNAIYEGCVVALAEAAGAKGRLTGFLGASDDPYLRAAVTRFGQFGTTLKKQATDLDKRFKAAHEERLGDRPLQEAKDEMSAIIADAGTYFDLLSSWLDMIARSGHEQLAALSRTLAAELTDAAENLRRTEISRFRPLGPQELAPLVAGTPSESDDTTVAAWMQNSSLQNRLGNRHSLIALLGPGVAQAKADPVEFIEFPTNIFSEGDLVFVEEMVERRKRNRVPQSHGWSHIPALDVLRSELVTSARIATQLISAGEGIVPITDWDTYENDLDADLVAELKDALASAASAATSLAQEARHGDPDLNLLGASALASRLRRLSNVLTPPDGSARIMGAQVNWLTDCAWHSLIFRSRIYPGVRELALQVDLCSSAGEARGPVRRLEPAEAIAHKKLDSLGEHTTRAVLRGFHPSAAATDERNRGALYRSIAERLWHEADSRRNPPPLAISMTFDLELERALVETRETRGPFHVLVPVLGKSTGGYSLRWLLGTYAAAAKDGQPPEDLLGFLRTPSWSDNTRRPPRAPVILKLNGSPLHRLPRFAGTDDRAEHALLLRELDSMDIGSVSVVANALQRGLKSAQAAIDVVQKPDAVVVNPSQAMPDWVLNKITAEDKNLWVVIGARWSDWSSRSQLFNLLTLPNEESKRMQKEVFAVSESVDLDRVNILRWLGVRLVRGDCLELIDPIKECAQ